MKVGIRTIITRAFFLYKLNYDINSGAILSLTLVSLSRQGSVAYVAQQAWIQNLTVRENILFGKTFDVCRYQDTVEACELKEDFEMLPASDQTEIGERVIAFSKNFWVHMKMAVTSVF